MQRLILIITAAIMLAPAGIARADNADNQFLGMLSNQGIQGAPDQLIRIAHELCGAADLPQIGLGVPPYATAMWKIRDEMLGMGNSYDQLLHFSRAANSVYCPDKQLPTA